MGSFYIGGFFFSSRRRNTISKRDWSSDVCSSDLSRSGDSPADDEDVEGVVRAGLLQRLECLLAEVGGQLTISHRQICAFFRTFSYGPAQVHRRRTGQVLPSADEADSQKLA